MARIREQAIFNAISPIFSPICGFIFRRSESIFSPIADLFLVHYVSLYVVVLLLDVFSYI